MYYIPRLIVNWRFFPNNRYSLLYYYGPHYYFGVNLKLRCGALTYPTRNFAAKISTLASFVPRQSFLG